MFFVFISFNITSKIKRYNLIFYDTNTAKSVLFSSIFVCKIVYGFCNLLIINIDCGAGGFRTHVQTGKYCAFYTFISAFICQIITRPEPPIITLVFKVSSKNQDLFRLFPIFLHHWIHWFGTRSLEWCLVPLPCNGIKLVIYYTSIKQRERSYFRQLIFW